MQKALVFLEQQVQWVALALAGVFLLFCVWAFVYTPPAVVIIGPKREPVTPAMIDDMTKDGPVRDIDGLMKGVVDVAINVPDVVKPWKAQMDGEGVKVAILPWTYPRSPVAPGTTGPKSGDLTIPGAIVNALPTLPKAQPQTPVAGLSVVAMPAGAGGNGGPAQPVGATTWDQHWSMASFVIPAKDLKAAFDKVLANKNLNLPLTTDILRVELQRQRGVITSAGTVFPNGEEGVETVAVPKLLQASLKPLPDPKASIPEKASYYDWAEKNVDIICQPKFYDVKGGTPWAAPVIGAAPAAAAPPAAKGLAAVPLAIGQQPAANQQNNGLFGAGAGAGGPGATHPPGQIAPDAINQDLLIWADDDTVLQGKVYRYRVVYYMKNPVVGLVGIGAPDIVNILPIVSPPSDWSPPVTVPQSTKFFFASVHGNMAMADVFHWESGAWTKRPSQVSAGDRLGDSDWRIIDVHGSTPGARDREKWVVLVNDAGEVVRRYPGADSSNEEYKALKAEVNPAAAGTGTGTTPPPPAPRGGRVGTPAGGARAGYMPRGG